VIHTVLSKLQEENSLQFLNELNLQTIVSRMRDQRPGLITQKVFFHQSLSLIHTHTHTHISLELTLRFLDFELKEFFCV
jgi:hypothetical protein